MRVMKFGGGCLCDADSFVRVSEIITTALKEGVPAVVVSAVFGVTNMLEEAARLALQDETSIQDTVTTMRNIHVGIARQILEDKRLCDETIDLLEVRLGRLERLLYGISYTGELSDVVHLLVLSQGERFSAILLTAALNLRDVPARSLESDEIGIITDDSCYNATADLIAVKENLQHSVVPLLREGVIPVVTGFFGRSHDGRISSFGRNGSDYSAAVIAQVLDADTVEIWKDVNGFMTADPQLIPDARSIEFLSYREAAELSYFGARLLHPRTVEPLIGTDIPIIVKNVYSPSGPVTIIQSDCDPRDDIVKSVTCSSNLSVLRIHGVGVGHQPGIIGDIGRALANVNINIYSVITAQTCINLLIDTKDIMRSQEVLSDQVGGVIERIEIRDDVALIAVVGEGLLTTHGLAARVFSAVARKGVNVEMFAAGASEVAYYFIVRSEDMKTAIQAVHDDYFGGVRS
ncbi:MAG: aspartate kinase [Candidatus Thorarchaeota archaeon]|nr:aspartate kinase [Candidatus Thorarchaeota archaeon]